MSSNKDSRPTQQASQSWAITIIVLLMRLVVGGIFVFSGFVKAIDPWGTMYKVNEYLMTLGWDRLADMSLFFAFALPVIELLLGVAIVVGAYRRSAPIGVLIMMAFMLTTVGMLYSFVRRQTNFIMATGPMAMTRS